MKDIRQVHVTYDPETVRSSNRWKVATVITVLDAANEPFNQTTVRARVSTQMSGFYVGRSLAKDIKAELFVHGRNGKIRFKNSYGNDPANVVGKGQ